MTTPQPGWYPDPAGDPSLQRYWDGTQWTNQTQPAQAQAPEAQQANPASPAQPAAAQAQQPAQQAAGGQAPQQAGGPQDMHGQQAAQSAPVSVGGITTDLLGDRFAEVASNQRVTKQNSRLLKVTLGQDILAKQGSMVAFQGQMDFNHEGSGASKFIKKAVTGEGVSLMRCTGQGDLFLADAGFQVHIIHLDGAGITVGGSNILAFEPTLNWEIERIKGAGMLAGGLFNTRLEGRGWVAITTDGDPVVLKTDTPTFADTDAAVAWSSSLQTSLNKTFKAGALIGRGSGEAVQLAFQGQGIVIVQPSEGSVVPPHSH